VLVHARLEGANFSAAKLEGADLGYADLEGATLDGAELQGADLGGQTDLTGASVVGAKVWRLQGTSKNQLANIKQINGELVP
jgi:uncharacterized protein YjbI with pentapeptide repeats